VLEIVRAGPDQAPVLRNLLQLYLYEMSQFEPRPIGPDGLYEYPHLDAYWHDDRRAAFLVRLSGRPAAFALVAQRSVFDPSATGVREVAEFFVLRQHRRSGLGRMLALDIFRRLPGRWEVRQTAENEAAQAFWRKVIAEYTGGRFVEVFLDDHRWRGPVQTFDNTLMVG
jgi:predicted acetyltransferase